jgi:long-chain fatty acid transport protein
MRRLLVIVALMVPAAARAGGFAIGEQSAVAGGTGGAGVAREGDPAAAWYNPAALAGGGGWRFGFGVLAALPQVSAQAMDGSWATDAEARLKTPPHLYMSRAAGDFAAGLALNVPFGSGVVWPQGWAGRFESQSSSVQVLRASPFAAWRFDRWRVAAGPHLDVASLAIRRRLDFIDTEGDVALDLRGVGAGLHVAAWYAASAELALGATYKSRTRVNLEGSADFTVPDAFTGRAADQRARATLTLPDLIAVGAAWRRGKVALAADLGVAVWSVYDELTIDFAEVATSDVHTMTRWQTRLSVRGGGEYQAAPALTLRAGGLYDPSPAPADTLAPTSPDADRLGLTAGAGWAVRGDLQVDGFYEYLHLRGRASAGDEALAARYGGHAHLIGLGVSYRR